MENRLRAGIRVDRNKVKEAQIHADVMGSDHCPVSVRIEL